MELDSLYQEVILDHYKHPLNKGLSETYGAQVHHVNPSCGDEITLNISAKDGVNQKSFAVVIHRSDIRKVDRASKQSTLWSASIIKNTFRDFILNR